MDKNVKQALQASITAYAENENIQSEELLSALSDVFELDAPFMEKVASFDEVFDNNLKFDELREFIFDLLMVNFFAADVEKLEADYLESEEWEAIEDETIDRGSEIINILLYLRECTDEQIEPTLDDFLKEFLLVDEDEFQDEHKIYELVIANQMLVESDSRSIAKVAEQLEEEDNLFEVFYALMNFFSDPNPSNEVLIDYKKNALNESLDIALYQLMINFNK